MKEDKGSSNSLRPTTFDRVWSLLTATLIVSGFGVLLMFGIWLTSGRGFLSERDGGDVVGFGLAVEESSPAPRGDQQLIANLSVSELPLVPEEVLLEQSLQAITQVLSDRSKELDDLGGRGGSSKMPPGDPREKRKSDRLPDEVPRWDRWRLHFETSSLATYARQLDSLGIELGAAGGGRAVVDYISNVSSRKPKRRAGPGKKERRLYMTWKSGELRAFDKQLLEKAGVETSGRVQLQFLPAELEARLARLEREFAKYRSVDEIKRTVFAVRGDDVRVKDMKFRDAR